MRKIQQAEVKGEKIIVRCDFNVPIKNGKVYEDFRIKAAIPTIEFLEKAGAAKIILISHLGRPDGARVRGLSLEPVAKKLKTILGEKTKIVQTKIADFPAYQISPKIILLENIRFWADEVPTPRLQHRGSGSRPAPMPKDRSSPTESDTRRSHRTDRSDAEGSELRPKRRRSVGEGVGKNNDSEFAKKLAGLADVFIFDAFGASHRDSVSCTGLAKILPSFAGLLVQKEVAKLTQLLLNPEKPFVLILGGKKTEDKLPVIKNLFGKIDTFIVAGETANTFLAAKDIPLGKSSHAQNLVSEAVKIMKMLLDEPAKDIFIPQDVVVSKSKDKPENVQTIDRAEIGKDDFIVDIGPKTVKMIEPKIAGAKTIFWNGSLGVTEVSEFARGSKGVAKIIAKSSGESVLAGGDTVAAVSQFGLLSKFSFVSTGGAAALEFLAGKRLPALEVLEE